MVASKVTECGYSRPFAIPVYTIDFHHVAKRVWSVQEGHGHRVLLKDTRPATELKSLHTLCTKTETVCL